VQAPRHEEPTAAVITRVLDQVSSRRGEVEGIRSVAAEQPVGGVPHLPSLTVAAIVEQGLQQALCWSIPFMA
jgi:hypothetical protein